MCFVDKAFDRVPWKVLEWAMRKKGIPAALVRSVIRLNAEAKTGVRVDSELSEELEVKVGMHQGCVLSSVLFSVVVDVIKEFSRVGALSELLCAVDLVLMSEIMEAVWNKFLELKESFEINDLKSNLVKIR